MRYSSFPLEEYKKIANKAKERGDANSYLDALVFSEQPYLAKPSDIVDDESKILFQCCHILKTGITH